MKQLSLIVVIFLLISCKNTNNVLDSKLVREFSDMQFLKHQHELNRMGRSDFIYPRIQQAPPSIQKLKPEKIILTKLGLYFVQKKSFIGGEQGIFVSIKNIKPRESSTAKYVYIDNRVYAYTIKFD